jgi:hypothetical protein
MFDDPLSEVGQQAVDAGVGLLPSEAVDTLTEVLVVDLLLGEEQPGQAPLQAKLRPVDGQAGGRVRRTDCGRDRRCRGLRWRLGNRRALGDMSDELLPLGLGGYSEGGKLCLTLRELGLVSSDGLLLLRDLGLGLFSFAGEAKGFFYSVGSMETHTLHRDRDWRVCQTKIEVGTLFVSRGLPLNPPTCPCIPQLLQF